MEGGRIEATEGDGEKMGVKFAAYLMTAGGGCAAMGRRG